MATTNAANLDKMLEVIIRRSSLQESMGRSEALSLLRWTMMPKRPVQVSAKPR